MNFLEFYKFLIKINFKGKTYKTFKITKLLKN